MSIPSVSSPPASVAPPSNQQIAQFKNDFQQLAQALQSGNLPAAQQAYATLNQFIRQNPLPSGPNGQSNRLTQALGQIGSALQSGNISSAQQTLCALQSAAGQARGGHDGGAPHAGGGGGGGSSSSSSSTIVSETSTTTPSGVTTTVVTYANGTQETTTTYSPQRNSSQGTVA